MNSTAATFTVEAGDWSTWTILALTAYGSIRMVIDVYNLSHHCLCKPRATELEEKSVEIKLITSSTDVAHLFEDCRHVKKMKKPTVQRVCLHCQAELKTKMCLMKVLQKTESKTN